MKQSFERTAGRLLLMPLLLMVFCCGRLSAQGSVQRINPTAAEILLEDGRRILIDFYADHIFRLFSDPAGGELRDPEAKPPARILADNPRCAVINLETGDTGDQFTVTTQAVILSVDKITALLTVTDRRTGKVILEESAPTLFGKNQVALTLKAAPQEYFYGGGVQNGRFSHRGRVIAIENQNSWTDGGVASPCPFYWSTAGYGVMWYTFAKGSYDFAATQPGIVKLTHDTGYLDLFVMAGDGAVPLLNDYWQLTGHPVLLPKFGFYEGHLNAYNRDYWTEDPEKGIPFEDGKRYKESQKDNGGVRESLNGENGNYPFSARAVIDRYRQHDMPLGWLLPNDGYGAGYGQTESLDGNIANLRSLTDYAHKHGVEIGLWTQSDLHPKPGIAPLLQRDLVKEVRDAGVRVLKTDVAWVGAGYSFGLNGIADASRIMTYYGNDARPFIISLDGWAGTQRYATIWSGDQTGGTWEYIRFHIPTYIGSGLSGNPNITSDMDGIFGGKNPAVNIRDFQWKAFTPMQLNMDGWGTNEKYPHALGEPAASINRMYLKLKSELLPYSYSIARQAVDGLPMMRAMFFKKPCDYTLGKSTQYQYMYGPWFLVAPIYQSTESDGEGNDIRNGIYLPKGQWIDYFTGDLYTGGCILNSYPAPLWQLPLLVENGAIIPLTHPNNNVTEIDPALRIYEVYPYGHTTFTEYDDDGRTEAWRGGQCATTLIESDADVKGNVLLTIHPAQGDFDGFTREKITELRINVTQKPRQLSAAIGKRKLKLTEAHSLDEFCAGSNVYYYDVAPVRIAHAKNPQLLVRLAATDITAATTTLEIKGFVFAPADKWRVTPGALSVPRAQITEANTAAYILKPSWDEVTGADFYEIEFGGQLYTTIRDTTLLFEGLNAETGYAFRVRAVNRDGHSDWAECSATTRRNPLEFALHGLTGETSAANQGRSLRRLFDFDEGELWHTRYNVNALPFDLTIDLHSVSRIDKFHYLPRGEAGNGTLLRGNVSYSMDMENWTDAGAFDWERSGETKVFPFIDEPTARYVRLHVTEAVGGYGSGRELYVFKVPGTESYLPGDINNDKCVDENDLTSYTNYTGLRRGDADFEGYISRGDLNLNGLIDAYDISVVATQLDGGILRADTGKVAGTISIGTVRRTYNKGETVEVRVKGTGLRSVNALSFALSYDPADFEFAGIQPLGMKQMENLTNDRLHTDGKKVLYPTFVNLGNKPVLEGDCDLFIIRLKARRSVRFDLNPQDIYLVDRNLGICRGATE